MTAASSGIYGPCAKIIRFARLGCTNRPFFHIVVTGVRSGQHTKPIEQLGTYDPLPNIHNEKLVSFNFDRIRYWMVRGAVISNPVAELLGLAGFLPVHPRNVMNAWRNRLTEDPKEVKSE